jgi:hypothetical protein
MLFWKNGKSNEIRRAMARLINTSFSLQADYAECADIDEQRSETRSKRIMPFAIFMDECGDHSIAVGFTRDLSLEGIAVVTTDEIGIDDLVVVIGDPQELFALRAQRVNSKSIGFGCFQAGLRFTELLRGRDVTPLLDYVAFLESSRDCVDIAARL